MLAAAAAAVGRTRMSKWKIGSLKENGTRIPKLQAVPLDVFEDSAICHGICEIR